MLGNLFNTVLIEPIYNAFVFLIYVAPAHSAGVAIILLTIVLRIIFLPMFTQALRTQHGMRLLEPELDAIREKYKTDRAEQGKATMELFRSRGVRPFASFFSLLIQLPVFIALYIVFLREGFPQIAENLLYSFTPLPEMVGVVFLGILNLTIAKNIALAVIVAGVQFLQSRLSMGALTQVAVKPERAQMMMIQKQMLYILPVVMGVVAYGAPAAAGLYLLTNALFSLGQEFVVRKRIDAEFVTAKAEAAQ